MEYSQNVCKRLDTRSNLRRIRIRCLSAGTSLHIPNIVRMRIIETRILAIIHIRLLRTPSTFPIFWLLLANTMHARARVDGIVDSPIVALAAICEGTCYFFEARVQGEIVADRILTEK